MLGFARVGSLRARSGHRAGVEAHRASHRSARLPTRESRRRRASNARWASGSPVPTCGNVAKTFSAARRRLEKSRWTPTRIRPLLGAHEGRPGAIVAAGTGSVGEALRRDGLRVAVGGWGFPVGDEGSGAWLGLRAMRETHRAIDGRARRRPAGRCGSRAGGHVARGAAGLVRSTGAERLRRARPAGVRRGCHRSVCRRPARPRGALARGNRRRARSRGRVAAGGLRQHRTTGCCLVSKHRSGRDASSRRVTPPTARFASSRQALSERGESAR